jgi:hypothetical protein
MSNIVDTRSTAMYWWNGLSTKEKYAVMEKHNSEIVHYLDRSPSSLTGREIQILYKSENKSL